MKQLRVLQVIVAIAALYFVVKVFWPLQLYYLTRFIRQPSCGCGLVEGLRSVPLSTNVDRGTTWFRTSARGVTRSSDGYELWDTAHGRFWAPVRDGSLFAVLGELEQNPYGDGAGLRDAVVLDCGAHLGVFTRAALSAGARQVVAVEPGPEQVECLRRTFKNEIAQGRVIVVPKALWNLKGEMNLNQTDSTVASTLMDPQETNPDALRGSAVTIQVTTIDDLVSELKLANVGFIKMDIEGAEVQALSGARQTFSRFKPRLAISAYHHHDDSKQIPSVVRQANSAYRLSSFRYRLDLPHSHPLTLFFD